LPGNPALRIVTLAETGTRGLLGAVIGGKGERSEVPLARKLVPLLREGMLLLADRAYDAADLMKEVSAAGAHFLVRGSATRKPPVDEVLPDGSCLSRIDGLRVRIIEAGLDVHGADGTRLGDSYRLITSPFGQGNLKACPPEPGAQVRILLGALLGSCPAIRPRAVSRGWRREWP
jgi:hypothetical protein